MNTWQFDAKETLAKGFARLMRAAVENAVRELSRTGDELDAGVHEGRKWIKKARALLKLCRPAMEKEQYRDCNRRLRDAGRAVSAVRDDAALCETAARLLARDDLSPTARRTLEALRDGISGDDRDDARKCAALAVRRLKRLLAETDFALRIPPGKEEGVLKRGLKQSLKGVQEACRASWPQDDTAGLHESRKRVKDLRYQAELLAGCWPGPVNALAEELHRLTDMLGWVLELSALRGMISGRALSRKIASEALTSKIDAVFLCARIQVIEPGPTASRFAMCWALWRAETRAGRGADHG